LFRFMIKNIKIRVRPEDWADPARLKQTVADQNAIVPTAIRGVRTLHRSIDARQRQVMIQLDLEVYINEEPPRELFTPKVYGDVTNRPHAVVVGAGPGGLFAALRLIEAGICPIVVERGRNVTDRRRDVAAITRTQSVDPESNYCFGEGGAGAFSDGKLFTRSKKRGNVQGVLERLCQFGANTTILSDAHPHIGTDKLPGVIAAIREQILRSGGEVHFETCMSDLLMRTTPDGTREVCGIVTRDGRTFEGPVILATGHSARDVYRMLYTREVLIEPKGIAMGVRLEHPQALIDRIQYHNPAGRGKYLPAAEYSFVTQVAERGVYSFCMCPGGVVVPSATAPEQVVVNGMSASTRGSRWANSAMVVQILPEDIDEIASQIAIDEALLHTPLAILGLQESLERQTWINGGRTQQVPAQRMTDFVRGRLSSTLPEVSYAPGAVASPLHFWMPKFISERLRQGFETFGRQARGFLSEEAVLLASETRTSSPVRIPRDREALVHPVVKGLYPCGEGAGFAGGIVSAAMDGERCAEALVAQCFR
jgi:uncharacterized FAD-dependent dehydrogenase